MAITAFCTKCVFQMGTSFSTVNSKLKRSLSHAENEKCAISWSWRGPPGEHSPYPVEKVADKGREVLYCFVDVLVAFKIMSTFDLFVVFCLCYLSISAKASVG